MLRKIFKIVGIVLAVIVVLALGYYAKAYFSTESRRNTTYDVAPQGLTLSTDSAILAQGAHLVKTKGCAECHGDDLGGKIFVDDGALGLLVAGNLTKGDGGLPKSFGTEEWVLALKHGLSAERKPLLFMPSHEFTLLSEKDMAALVSYLDQLPAVDRVMPENDLGFLARILTDLGKLPLFPAEMIDHTQPLIAEVKEEVSIEFGKYLATSCQGCHRENMKGGDPVAPGFPVVADISASGHPGKWTDEQFIQTLRTGVTPEGKSLKPTEMPWPVAKAMTDTELRALHLYLNSL